MKVFESIEKKPTMEQQILDVPVGDAVKVHAPRLNSFKATIIKINRERKENKVLFSYSDIKQEYYTATRIA